MKSFLFLIVVLQFFLSNAFAAEEFVPNYICENSNEKMLVQLSPEYVKLIDKNTNTEIRTYGVQRWDDVKSGGTRTLESGTNRWDVYYSFHIKLVLNSSDEGTGSYMIVKPGSCGGKWCSPDTKQLSCKPAPKPVAADPYAEAFVEAACQGDDNSVKLYLNSRALNINYVGSKGQTALTCAAERYNWKIVAAILDQTYFPLDISVKNKEGKSLLFYLENADQSVLKLVKDKKIYSEKDFFEKMSNGKTFFDHTDKESVLAKIIDINSLDFIKDAEGHDLLFYAVQANNPFEFEELLKNPKADYRQMNKDGETFLSQTVRNCKNEAAAKIAENIVSLSIKNKDLKTLLWENPSKDKTLINLLTSQSNTHEKDLPPGEWLKRNSCRRLLQNFFYSSSSILIPNEYFNRLDESKVHICKVFQDDFPFNESLRKNGIWSPTCEANYIPIAFEFSGPKIVEEPVHSLTPADVGILKMEDCLYSKNIAGKKLSSRGNLIHDEISNFSVELVPREMGLFCSMVNNLNGKIIFLENPSQKKLCNTGGLMTYKGIPESAYGERYRYQSVEHCPYEYSTHTRLVSRNNMIQMVEVQYKFMRECDYYFNSDAKYPKTQPASQTCEIKKVMDMTPALEYLMAN